MCSLSIFWRNWGIRVRESQVIHMITSAEDVAFDINEVIIEEDDYYTDGTITSDSYNDSEGFWRMV